MFQNYKNLTLLEGGASKKKIYRFSKKNKKFIILDFSNDESEFKNHLNIYNILKKIEISIPKIFEVNYNDKILVTEDFGDQRYDKVYNSSNINTLIKYAVESLIIFNNYTINIENTDKLLIYNYDIFYKEISEFVEFFMPFRKINSSLNVIFLETWKEYYNNFNFEYDTLVHKDFELTNLMYLPEKKNHLKCGILDFQNAFKGFKGWDLFSLLENSRIYFSREENEKLIKYYYDSTYPNLEFDLFRNQYYFLNTSRQTRLLGRWVKFSVVNKNNSYLKYIDITIKRLKESLINLKLKKLNEIYDKILN